LEEKERVADDEPWELIRRKHEEEKNNENTDNPQSA
jgi:hypothetical protein